jgi:DNA invertase Pin-like site-specific DNA recombinase
VKTKYVSYYRVSTRKQGIDGLGMDAQRAAVRAFLNTGNKELLEEFSEVETGKRNERPELAFAIAACRKAKATLLIAKLDRLSRNAGFLLSLQAAGINLVCCDVPQADRLTIGILAVIAEQEGRLISERTKAGMEAAKRRGIRMGNPRPAKAVALAVKANKRQASAFAKALQPVVEEIRQAGVTSLHQIALCLNRRGYQTRTGKSFAAQSVKNLFRHFA